MNNGTTQLPQVSFQTQQSYFQIGAMMLDVERKCRIISGGFFSSLLSVIRIVTPLTGLLLLSLGDVMNFVAWETLPHAW